MVDTLSDIPLPKRLGKNLARTRKTRGWTQATLAERLGMEPESISRFERGATLPSLATLEQIAAFLDTSIADLLAEYPDTAYAEAQRISALMADLEPDARASVLSIVKTVCATLRRR
ncbi:MAG: helix-turn-helix transcriptional regulator [Dechloromonas sp.]|jgi:transcriptional regulator with XRE-family HTH domain|nr:helix-turn-helix transcriptional regulator [Dechloromonas sp.]MBN8461561.1 helix-turn-helix transcriptional regulator [Dechloromonas sp.]